MNYKLIIAEKPSVASNIAEVVGANEKVKDEKGNGYLRGNGFVVTWCYGHLVELYEPQMYDEKYKKWSIDDLPIIPENFRYMVKSASQKQFNVIKQLINSEECLEVISGTDAAREGELIFRLVSSLAKNKKPTKRLWLNSMENSAITEALNNLKDISYYDCLYYSALARQRADWLFGINFSRYYSCRYNEYLSYGRVQTVVVKFLVDRKKEIENFVSKEYYKVNIHLNDDYVTASVNVDTKTESDMLLNHSGNLASINSYEKNETKTNPPLLYDLTTLQREANKYFGYSASLTLKVLQSLYEKKLASYPRTDSCYITRSEKDSVENLLSYIISLGLFPNKAIIPKQLDLSRVVNDSKVNDHSALLPTKNLNVEVFAKLSGEEKNILLMICYRLLAVASEPYVVNKVKAEFSVDGSDCLFTASGTDVIQYGFKAVENTLKKVFGIKVNSVKGIPSSLEKDFYDKNKLEVTSVDSNLEHTKAPPHYTDDTLLSAMENCGNKINEETLKEAVKECGLGTPATRAAIIEEIINKKFATREKKAIVATKKAMAYIPLVNPKLVKADLTGEWELQLNKISNGTYSYSTFMSEITSFIEQTIDGCKNESIPDSDKNIFRYKDIVGICPKCGKYVLEKEKVYSCEKNNKDKDCDFILFKTVGPKNNSKSLTVADVESLLTKGRTKMKKFLSKNNKEYSCYFVFDENLSPYLKMEFPKKISENNRKTNDGGRKSK